MCAYFAGISCKILKFLVILQFFFNHFAESRFQLYDPGWQRLWLDLPVLVFFLHMKNDPVAAVVTDIYGGKRLLAAIRFAEIEFPHPAIGFQHFGELNIFYESDLHKSVLK